MVKRIGICLSVTFLLTFSSNTANAQWKFGEGSGFDDLTKVSGKWVVTAVDCDGELPPAQIGQRIGDLISFRGEAGSVRIT